MKYETKFDIGDQVRDEDIPHSQPMTVNSFFIDRNGIHYRCEWWSMLGTFNIGIFIEDGLVLIKKAML